MGKLGMPPQEENPCQASPRTTTSSNSSTSSSNSNGGGTAPAPAPSTPRSLPRSDANPYPTTFVQADAASFKQVVQMLTGPADTASRHRPAATAEAPSARSPVPPGKTGPRRPAFKLYERRHGSFKSLKAIGPLLMPAGGGFSPRKQSQPEILSPSVLDFPALTLSSPVTPLTPDPFDRPPHPAVASAEERAIAQKGFYLHPSPRATPGGSQAPRLLPLFPVTSPGVSFRDPSSAASS